MFASAKIQQKQAIALREALAPFLDSDEGFHEVVRYLLTIVSRCTIPEPGTTSPFIMLHPKQFIAVANWLAANSKRPAKALHTWIVLLGHFKKHTGEITLTRDQIAEKVNVHPNTIGTVMREMVRYGAIFSKREKIPGLRGPGKVVYYMNKHVAETGSRATKEELDKIPKPGADEES